MNCKELRIGDWVMLNGSHYQIEEISQKGWVHMTRNGIRVNMTTDYLLEVLQPIPITAEILKANGFEEDPEDGTMCWGNKELEEVTWRGTILKIDSLSASLELVSCMYLHQLQHALKLCGIEEEIKLEG